MKKEIIESPLMTKVEGEKFKFNNRGKVVNGTYNRFSLGRGKWKKHRGDAGVFINAKGIWKEVKYAFLKGVEKKNNPLAIGWTQKKSKF